MALRDPTDEDTYAFWSARVDQLIHFVRTTVSKYSFTSDSPGGRSIYIVSSHRFRSDAFFLLGCRENAKTTNVGISGAHRRRGRGSGDRNHFGLLNWHLQHHSLPPHPRRSVVLLLPLCQWSLRSVIFYEHFRIPETSRPHQTPQSSVYVFSGIPSPGSGRLSVGVWLAKSRSVESHLRIARRIFPAKVLTLCIHNIYRTLFTLQPS